jgi:ABC-2 type transport system permease protein
MNAASALTSANKNLHAVARATAPNAQGSRLVALWALYVLSLRQHLNGRRWMIAMLLFMLPGALALVVRITAPDVPSIALEFMFSFLFVPQAILPLLALLYASGMIQDEQENQTLTYLLIRPISKWALYIVKLLATLTTTVALTAIFTVILYAAIYIGAKEIGQMDVPLRCLKAVAIHSLAVISYCSLFGLMSLLTKRVLIVGIVYTALFEGLLANFPFSIRLATIIYYTRLIAYRSMTFLVPTPRGTDNAAAEVWQFDLRKDPQLLDHPSLSGCLEVLLIASLVCTVLAALLCWQREFYVKTPEKNG